MRFDSFGICINPLKPKITPSNIESSNSKCIASQTRKGTGYPNFLLKSLEPSSLRNFSLSFCNKLSANVSCFLASPKAVLDSACFIPAASFCVLDTSNSAERAEICSTRALISDLRFSSSVPYQASKHFK